MKTCPICKTEFTPRGKRKTVYCPNCRKNKNLCTANYRSQHRPHKYCKVCGKEIINHNFNYCPDCNTPEKRRERAMIRQRRYQHEHIGECLVCGDPVFGHRQYCNHCRGLKNRGNIQNLTLNITLFFTVLRGLSLKQAAREQILDYKKLQTFMDEQKDTVRYRMLYDKYEAERRQRESTTRLLRNDEHGGMQMKNDDDPHVKLIIEDGRVVGVGGKNKGGLSGG
jgi:hypothetical protein